MNILIRLFCFAMLAVCAFGVLSDQLAAQTGYSQNNKVRLFITDDPLFESYAFNHSSAGFYATANGAGGGAQSSGFAANPNGKADPRTVELQADMQKSCPQFTVTSVFQNADYILWFRRNDQHRTKMFLLLGATGGLISAVQKVNGASLFNANGDMVYATREKTVGGTIKDVCEHVANPTPQLVASSHRMTENSPQPKADALTSAALNKPSAAITVNSRPTGGEIYLDGNFVGDTPSTINAQSGEHAIIVKKSGFQNWSRDVTVTGGAITLGAELSPGVSEPVAVPAKKVYTVTEVPSGDAAHKRASQASLIEVKTPRGWIGAETKLTTNGVTIVSIAPDGPAAKAGLRVGDEIQKLNGKVVKDTDFEAVISSLKPGTEVLVSYMRSAWARETLMEVGKLQPQEE